MLKQLSEREKFALLLGVSGITLFVVLRWIIFPALDQRRITERQVAVKIDEIVAMQALQSEYQNIRTAAAAIVVVMLGIKPYVEQAVAQAGFGEVPIYYLPFPAQGHQRRYVKKLVEVLKKLREIDLRYGTRIL